MRREIRRSPGLRIGVPLGLMIAGVLGMCYLLSRPKSYYASRFAHAQTMTITSSSKDHPGRRVFFRTTDRELFTRFEQAMRKGFVGLRPPSEIPSWWMDLTDSQGHTTRIAVGTCLYAKGQPLAHRLFFYPVLPEQSEDNPGIYGEVDLLMRSSLPQKAPAKRP